MFVVEIKVCNKIVIVDCVCIVVIYLIFRCNICCKVLDFYLRIKIGKIECGDYLIYILKFEYDLWGFVVSILDYVFKEVVCFCVSYLFR